MSKRKNISPQMFDVRPTNRDGSLNLERMSGIRKAPKISRTPKYVSRNHTRFDVVRPPQAIQSSPKIESPEIESYEPRPAHVVQMGRVFPDNFISISRVQSPEPEFHVFEPKIEIIERSQPAIAPARQHVEYELPALETRKAAPRQKRLKLKKKRRERGEFSWPRINLGRAFQFPAVSFASAIMIFSLAIPTASLIQKSLNAKNSLMGYGQNALGEFAKAKDNLSGGNFQDAAQNFDQSYEILKSANGSISEIGGNFSEVLKYVPGISKIATAQYLTSAGEHFALAGKKFSAVLSTLPEIGNPLGTDSHVSLTDLFLKLKDGVQGAQDELNLANDNISQARVDDLPDNIRPQFLTLKSKLPIVIDGLKGFTENSQIFLDLLGYNGPRKFLFIFQNNQEMRATGGFIGSYGVLDINNGHIKKLFVDDIYNPDGQLRARVIPPEPIQKMSAVWTMHDANWFPDFPTSAEKVAWFYEKTGGPTVDGVVSMTPDIIQKLLTVTGPIEMPDYNLTIDSDNFVETTQNEIENVRSVDNDQPKKIISDLMPKILEKVLNAQNSSQMIKLMGIMNDSLKEKQLLIYSRNLNIEKLISREGWSGEVLNTSKDYLSVINSNIDGYKTDGVIDETIEHHADIGADGVITDEVTITRKHNGGNEKYDWWNKVNGDWMRVMVPEGSKLVETSGQTREFVSPPLDYQTLGFQKDAQVSSEQESASIDEKSGTRVFTENHKTVFANWVYVSPGETATVRYKYILPFKLTFDGLQHPAQSYSVLYQKQSGSRGSTLNSTISFPSTLSPVWKFPDVAASSNKSLSMNTKLATDKYIGTALQKKP